MLVCSMLSQRSLRHFFSFFFLYFVPQQRFPSLCLPAHLLVLLPHVFCYLFLSSVFFISVIVVFCKCVSSSRSLLRLVILGLYYFLSLLCASILFLRPWVIFTITTLNHFQLSSLSPFHLVVLVDFYLVLSSGTYFSAISFSLSLWPPFHRL